MELKEALLKRRSIRRFTEEPVSEELIDALLHAAMSGPTKLGVQRGTNEHELLETRKVEHKLKYELR